jgi:hypothetical protein
MVHLSTPYFDVMLRNQSLFKNSFDGAPKHPLFWCEVEKIVIF